MQTDQRMRFIFGMLDGDHDSRVNASELVMAIMTTSRGLARMKRIAGPSMAIIQELVLGQEGGRGGGGLGRAAAEGSVGALSACVVAVQAEECFNFPDIEVDERGTIRVEDAIVYLQVRRPLASPSIRPLRPVM